MDMRTKIALVDNKPMGRTTLHWTTVANAPAAGLDHGVCDGPTWAAVMAAEIARVEGAKPLPTMCNRSESGGFFWEVGNPGDTRPFATGDRGSKAIEKMAGQQPIKLQRRRKYAAARYAAMSPEEKAAFLQRERDLNPARMEAGTSARAAAVAVLPGHFLAGDRLCIFRCGRPANARECPACPQCCREHKEWDGCKSGTCKAKGHRNPGS